MSKQRTLNYESHTKYLNLKMRNCFPRDHPFTCKSVFWKKKTYHHKLFLLQIENNLHESVAAILVQGKTRIQTHVNQAGFRPN